MRSERERERGKEGFDLLLSSNIESRASMKNETSLKLSAFWICCMTAKVHIDTSWLWMEEERCLTTVKLRLEAASIHPYD